MMEDRVYSYLNNRMTLLPDMAKSYASDRATKLPKPELGAFWRVSERVRRFLESEGERNRIIIMPGLRGVGKTTTLFQLYEKFRGMFGKDRILYIDCNDLKANEIGLNDLLSVYELKVLGEPFTSVNDRILLLIDEAHADAKWEAVVKSLNDRTVPHRNVYTIVSGSSSIALDISTDLARRRDLEWVFPLDFFEYRKINARPGEPMETLKMDGHAAEGLNRLFTKRGSNSEFAKDLDRTERQSSEIYKSFKGADFFEQNLGEYLYRGGFPFLQAKETDNLAFQSVIDIINRIIEHDLPLYTSLSSSTISKVMPLLQMLSSGTDRISYETMGSVLGLSKSKISGILRALEKAGLIFGVKPMGSVKNMVSSSWKYYFTTPAVKAALLWSAGKFEKSSEKMGWLLETYVADVLWKKKLLEPNVVNDFFFLSQKGFADFLIKSGDNMIIMECGWGEKNARQAAGPMETFNAGLGIIVSKTGPKVDGNIIFIPLRLFFMM